MGGASRVKNNFDDETGVRRSYKVPSMALASHLVPHQFWAVI
jgi:hypothetical protein